MFEVEMKFRVDDSTGYISRLKENFCAHFSSEVLETDLFFQHPIRDFSQTDECLRLRRRDNNLFITYKGAKLDSISKTREEIELPLFCPALNSGDSALNTVNSKFNSVDSVSNSDTVLNSIDRTSDLSNESCSVLQSEPIEISLSDWTRLLNRLGFREVAVVAKKRRYGSLLFGGQTVTVTLDFIENLGTFTELELSSETESNIEKQRNILLTLASKLCLRDTIRTSYLELCLARKN